MAVRSKNAHWKMRGILRQHWLALAVRHGILTEDGRDADRLIDESTCHQWNELTTSSLPVVITFDDVNLGSFTMLYVVNGVTKNSRSGTVSD